MGRIGFWIANEDKVFHGEDYYFWLRDIVQSQAAQTNEFLFFGREEQRMVFDEYINPGKSGQTNYHSVPYRTKFEATMVGLNWKFFRVFEEGRNLYRSQIKIFSYVFIEKKINFLNTLNFILSPFVLTLAVCLQVLGRTVMSILEGYQTPTWDARLIKMVYSKKVDCVVVPNIGMHLWTGLKCPTVLWDYSFSKNQIETANELEFVSKDLKRFSKIVVSSEETEKYLNQVAGMKLSYNLSKFPIGKRSSLSNEQAKEKVRTALLNEYAKNNNFYYPDLDLGNIPFIVCSSQDNGDVGFVNLVKAFSRVIKERRVNCKLVFTIRPSQDVVNLVTQLGLFLDVIWFEDLKPIEVEAFTCQSRCLVVPTVEQSDFPALFFRAHYASVPVCTAVSPVVVGKLKSENITHLSFEPSSIEQIATALVNALNKTELNVKKQNDFVTRNYKDNWNEFVSALSS